MKFHQQVVFWSVLFVSLVLLFSNSLGNVLLSFYFVSFLFPVIVLSSWYFNDYLVPRFLMTERRGAFILHCFYMLVVSLYLEILVILISLVILADYSIANLGGYSSDLSFLALVLYLVVFGYSFFKVYLKLKARERQLEIFEKAKQTETTTPLILKVNRRQVPIGINEIRFIESYSDYVKVHLTNDSLITREKISHLEEKLGEQFLRIHRSYLVNRQLVEAFTKDTIQIAGRELTIGRTYRQTVGEVLTKRLGQ